MAVTASNRCKHLVQRTGLLITSSHPCALVPFPHPGWFFMVFLGMAGSEQMPVSQLCHVRRSGGFGRSEILTAVLRFQCQREMGE